MSEAPYIPSILNSVKKSLNIPETVSAFDPDLVMLINTVFAKLNQLGVGPEDTFEIHGADQNWENFYDNADLNMVRTYVLLETRLMFDPPTASVLTAMQEKVKELEWRLNVLDDQRLYESDQNESGHDDE